MMATWVFTYINISVDLISVDFFEIIFQDIVRKLARLDFRLNTQQSTPTTWTA